MTPLHIEILLHYFYSRVDFPEVKSNKTRQGIAYELCRRGYLFTPKRGKDFMITDCGDQMVHIILKKMDMGL